MSTIVTDTITGKSTATTITIGSTPVVSASANSMTIRGEGSNQTSIQQGLAKGWSNFDQRTSLSVTDSFNLSSQTDVAAGNIAITMANNMSDGGYVVSGTTQYVDGTENDLVAVMGLRRGVAKTSSGYETMVCSVLWQASAGADVDSVMTIAHGDLA